MQQGSSGVATAAARGDAVLKPVEATPVTTPAVSANPVQPASHAASRAAANATIPGAAESPRIQAESFVVDFGKAFSGDQVRRTVVLNMTAAGEAEFILNAQAAPGFGIAEVRAMGAGASAPPVTGATSLSQRNNTMAVRHVAQRLTAPPWKLRVSEPTELQVDVVYAPKFDAFNNMAGPKSVQLDARVRNVRGEGMGVPFELRAQFQGLQLGVSVAVKTPTIYQRYPSSVVPSQPQPLEPGAVTLSVANLSGAPLTLKIDAQELPARGLAVKPIDIYLGKSETRLVDVPLTYVPGDGELTGADDAGKPAALRLSASNGWQGSVGFRVVQVVDRRWEASGPNWWVGVHLGRDGSYHIYSRCHLNFPQTEYDCRFLIDVGNGVARHLLLAPRINANPRCAYLPGSVTSATAENVAAAMATPKVILKSVDGKANPGLNTFHEKRVLQQVPHLAYGEDCVSQFSRDQVPRY